MRVLVIHPRMSVFGGGERVAVNSIITTLNRGHEVLLLSEEFDVAAFEDFFACQGLFKKIRRITYPNFRPVAGRAVLYQRLLYHQWRVRSSLPKTEGFDMILSTQDVAYLPRADVPIVQYCYFPEYFVHLESNPSSPLWKTYYWPATMFYHKRVGLIDRLLSTSNFTRGFVREKWHRESTTLYPPCPIELYNDLNGPKEDLVVTVGRVVPEKRMDLFLEMARQLPMVKFAIIGSATRDQESYLRHLREIAPPNASFVMSPLRKVRDVLARSKVYVHCARNEHFGITIVEAMASGCVPVVHDSGGPREIVTDAVGSKWTIVGDAVKQISDLITDDSLRMKLSKAASSRANLFGPEAFQLGLGEVLARYENNSELERQHLPS
jgi:glycosyltransferase involved in cell wall biosynthesis